MNKKQKKIFDRIKEILESGEPMPTVGELGMEFGMTQQAMSKNLKVLEEENLIIRDKGRHRHIKLAEPPAEARKVPLLGRIAAGSPLEPVVDQSSVEIPASLVPKGNVYGLEVQGDSMIEDGILEGDVVLIKEQSNAFNGQTVVAVVDREATLKRYYHEGNRIRLQPANSRLLPIFVSPEQDFEIRGVVFMLYRNF